MAQEGGFVKKKLADGGDVRKLSELAQEYEYNLTDPIPTEQDLLKEVDPISDSAIKQADIEFAFDTINKSKNDPVIRAAFQDAQSRMPSEYIEMRNMGGRGRQILSQKILRDIRLKNPDRDFTSEPLTPEELEGGRQRNYYDDDDILQAQRLGKKTLDNPDFDFRGQYFPPRNRKSPLGDRILTRAYGEEKDPIDVSATMFHELLHKGHQKLVGIPMSRVEEDSKGNLKYVRTTPAERQRGRLLHLDVHRRTYEAYKDELSPDSLKDFVEDVYSAT